MPTLVVGGLLGGNLVLGGLGAPASPGGGSGLTEEDLAAIVEGVLAGIPAALNGVFVEDGVSLPQAVSYLLSVHLGIGPGVVSGTATFKNPAGTATRVVAAAAGGNRTDVELHPYTP